MNTSVLPYTGKKKTIVTDHTTNDIVSEVVNAHKAFAKDYDLIAKQFWKGNQLATIQYLFKYCKKNFPYRVETEQHQTTRSPGAILATADKIGVDCKHYAGWIAGILDALNRTGKNFNWKYRFASYDLFKSTPEHVFVAVDIGGTTYWVDPVLPSFNQRAPGYIYSFDKKPAMQKRIGTVSLESLGVDIGQNKLIPRPTTTTTVTPTIIPRTLPTVITRVNQTATPAANESLAKYLPLLLIGGAVLYFATRKRRKK